MTPPPSWTTVARLAAIALIGAPLTYGVYYAQLIAAGPVAGHLPSAILLALSVLFGGMLMAGLRWTRLLYPAGLLAGFLVAGHLVWAVVDRQVGAAFALSNWAEMWLAILLTIAADPARADPAAAR